jgi:predicted kinase
MKCPDCRAPALAGSVRCASCAAKRAKKIADSVAWQKAHPEIHRAHALAYQAKNKAAGLCVKCGDPVIPDRVHCRPCAEKAREHASAYRARNKAAGLCVKCGQSAMAGRTLCVRCAERQRAPHTSRT